MPIHVALIMDGNGRWAKARHRPRTFGHAKGLEQLKQIVKAASNKNIQYLSLFAFSCENWNRPKSEIQYLLSLLNRALDQKMISQLNELNIQFHWIGFKNKIPTKIIQKLLFITESTKRNNGMKLFVMFNYGGQQDILHAAKQSKSNIDFPKHLLTSDLPPVDLLIRTGKEQRISNFLLWHIAYAEIIFQPKYWPEYTVKTFYNDLDTFAKRERRFGTIK